MSLFAVIEDFYRNQLPVMAVFGVIVLLPFVALERWRPVAKFPDYAFNIAISVSTLALAVPFGLAAAHASAAIRVVAPWPSIEFTFTDISVGIDWLDMLLRGGAMILLPLIIHDLWFFGPTAWSTAGHSCGAFTSCTTAIAP